MITNLPDVAALFPATPLLSGGGALAALELPSDAPSPEEDTCGGGCTGKCGDHGV